MAEKVTVPEIVKKKHRGEKITCLTAYDYSFARILDARRRRYLAGGRFGGMCLSGTGEHLAGDDGRDDLSYSGRGARVASVPWWSEICRFSPIR